ncbi:hypothetical protein D3C73_1201090 [compost metagenome]
MDQRQPQADGNGCQSCRCTFVGGAEDDQDEHRGHHQFTDKPCRHRIAARRVFAVAVGRQASRQFETGFAAGNEVQQRGGNHTANDLGNDVGRQFLGRKPPTHHQAEGYRRIEMTAGNMADGESHGQHCQAKREGHPEQTDPHLRKSRRQHCAAATTQHQPERTYQLSRRTF